jgi:hypothetical protein
MPDQKRHVENLDKLPVHSSCFSRLGAGPRDTYRQRNVLFYYFHRLHPSSPVPPKTLLYSLHTGSMQTIIERQTFYPSEEG